MDGSINGESLVVFQSSAGAETRAAVVRLERHLVVFEVYSPGLVLRMSELLANFKIVAGDRAIYAGRAVVTNVISMATGCVVEAGLEEGWLDLDLGRVDWSLRLREGYDQFICGLRKGLKVLPEFKVAVADMQMALLDLRQWLEQVELAVRSSPSGDRLKLEQQVAADLGDSTTATLSGLFERFEDAAGGVDAELAPSHTAFARRQLHPLLLCSPFLYRCFQKPLGYAGDYEMVNMILRDPLEGSSLFAKLVNLWFWLQAPAQAHRNRVRYLADRLVQETARVIGQGRRARVFNIGCGPAGEVQAFLREQEISSQVEFHLLDFNEETLRHGLMVLQAAKEKNQRSTSLNFVKKSVHQMLKEAGKSVERPADKLYDVVYCAGLTDYLPDAACRRFLGVLYDYVTPGGVLITTNVDESNPRRVTMEYVMDWHLIYRSGKQFEALRPEQSRGEDAKLTSDMTGVNLYYEIRKPKNA